MTVVSMCAVYPGVVAPSPIYVQLSAVQFRGATESWKEKGPDEGE